MVGGSATADVVKRELVREGAPASSVVVSRERAAAHSNTYNVDFYAEALKASAMFRGEYDGRMNVVKASEMPFERSPNGLDRAAPASSSSTPCASLPRPCALASSRSARNTGRVCSGSLTCGATVISPSTRSADDAAAATADREAIALQHAIDAKAAVEKLAGKYYEATNFIFMGRGPSFSIALEGALKLKEISYIHAEAYAAGELKHGPLALVDEDIAVAEIAVGEDQLFDRARLVQPRQQVPGPS